MLNKVLLVGRLTRDVDLRKTANGTSTVSTILAVNRDFSKDGQPDADFINCVAWGKTAETMANNLHKGSLIDVEGKIQTRNYDNQQGQKVYVTEVLVSQFHFLEPKEKNENQPYQPSYSNNDTLDISSDDLPF